MKIILMCLIIWFVVLSDLEVSFTYKNVKHTAFWNGLLWCTLDYYSIIKYQSKDTPMKMLQYKRTVV